MTGSRQIVNNPRMRCGGCFFIWQVVSQKLRATDVPSVALCRSLRTKTGGVASRQTPYFCPATKCLLFAEGISSARFPRHPITTELNKPARYRGASLSV